MNWLVRTLAKGEKKRAGFTLVELMIVIIIVGVLAAAAVPIYTAYVRKARTSEAKATIGSIRSAEEVYFAEHGVFLPFLNETVVAGDFAIATEPLTILGCDIIHNTWWKGAGVTFTVDCPTGNLTLNYISATAADTAVPPPEIKNIMVKLYCTGTTDFDEGDWEVTGL